MTDYFEAFKNINCRKAFINKMIIQVITALAQSQSKYKGYRLN